MATMATILFRGNRAVVSNTPVNTLRCFRVLPKHLGQSAMCYLRSKSSPPQNCFPLRRIISSTSFALHKDKDDKISTTLLHSLYHEQMTEIQNEREAIFGSDDSDESSSNSPTLTQMAKPYFASTQSSSHPLPPSPSPSTTTFPESSNAPQFLPPGWNAEEAYAERESLFAFTEEEQQAWNNRGVGTGNSQDVAAHNTMLRELIRGTPADHDHNHDHHHDNDTAEANTSSPSSTPSPLFSHLTPRGDGVSMVDVGHKASTRRVALARSVVVFPPEVLLAFQVIGSDDSGGKNEMIGPKGPIFETAKIAGILAAKKTSDLIPLCHPLPLDRVNIQIELENNQAIIECECRVTHTTGVEMEALTGATIAALTIYDMVKAVSHRVKIGPTSLVSKSGGKSDFVRGQ